MVKQPEVLGVDSDHQIALRFNLYNRGKERWIIPNSVLFTDEEPPRELPRADNLNTAPVKLATITSRNGWPPEQQGELVNAPVAVIVKNGLVTRIYG